MRDTRSLDYLSHRGLAFGPSRAMLLQVTEVATSPATSTC